MSLRQATILTFSAVAITAFAWPSYAAELAHWTLDEISGTIADDATAPDSAANEYDATLGGTSFDAVTPGPVGGGLFLQPSAGHSFYADSNLSLGGKSAASFSFWIKSPWDFEDVDNVYQAVIGQHYDWSNRIGLIYREGGGGDGYLAWDHRDGVNPNYRPGGTNMSGYQNQWIHVAAVYDAGNYKTYINGGEVFDNNGSIPSITADTANSPFGVANQQGPGMTRPFLASTFDDIGVWDSALDESFVRALYELGLPSSFENLSSEFGISYNAIQVQELFDAHAVQGAVTVSGTQQPWMFVDGLDAAFTGGAVEGELFSNAGHTYLLIDGAIGTGMQLLPEPSSCALLVLGLLGMLLPTGRRRRSLQTT